MWVLHTPLRILPSPTSFYQNTMSPWKLEDPSTAALTPPPHALQPGFLLRPP